jgi:hypothetical protein
MRETGRTTAAQARATSSFASRARSLLCAAATLASSGCGSRTPAPAIRTIDLIRQFAHAETRPLAGSFQIAEHTFGGRAHTSLVVPVPSRVIWVTTLPERAWLHVAVAVAPQAAGPAVVTFRIGISDDRIYDRLIERTISSAGTTSGGWTDLAADLSLYAGRKLSLFYRPHGRKWRVVFSSDRNEGAAAAVWGAPGIDTDSAAARRFLAPRR